MTGIATAASDIAAEFDSHVDIDQDDVEDNLSELHNDYKVPMREAVRTVRNNLKNEHDLSERDLQEGQPESASSFDPTPIEEINEANSWHDLHARVVELWSPSHQSMAQVGLLGDDTDIIKFVIWKNNGEAPVELLEEGETYRIQNVVTEEYQGRYSVKLNRTTTVEHDEKAEGFSGGSTNNVTVEGTLVDVKSGSGLIKRCTHEDCTRVLNKGRCAVHGNVSGEFDLRIKAVIDDGITAQDVVFGREMTEGILGSTLEDAKQKAMDTLDTDVITNDIKAEVLGEYFVIEGPQFNQNVLVDSFETVNGITADSVSALREKLEARQQAAQA